MVAGDPAIPVPHLGDRLDLHTLAERREGAVTLIEKRRQRSRYSFANLNFLGRCNLDCFFCLGKDLPDEFGGQDHTARTRGRRLLPRTSRHLTA